jgi:hypothetical protein
VTALAYHDLTTSAPRRFAKVRMLGRGPFVGLHPRDARRRGGDGVALDTRLIDGDPPRPEAFVAVASDSAAALDPLAVVQLPEGPPAAAGERRRRLARASSHAARQKLKEVEAASAERWVKIQRFEHGLKELEEENRKARDKAVRLSKELEDERKLRQRIELDAQMNAPRPGAPQGPRPRGRAPAGRAVSARPRA